MRVTFQSLRPMLRTKDLTGTVAFWTDRLGFRCDGIECAVAIDAFDFAMEAERERDRWIARPYFA